MNEKKRNRSGQAQSPKHNILSKKKSIQNLNNDTVIAYVTKTSTIIQWKKNDDRPCP